MANNSGMIAMFVRMRKDATVKYSMYFSLIRYESLPVGFRIFAIKARLYPNMHVVRMYLLLMFAFLHINIAKMCRKAKILP